MRGCTRGTFIEAHASKIAATVPEGMVQVRVGDNDDGVTMTPDEARELHAGLNGTHHDE